MSPQVRRFARTQRRDNALSSYGGRLRERQSRTLSRRCGIQRLEKSQGLLEIVTRTTFIVAMLSWILRRASGGAPPVEHAQVVECIAALPGQIQLFAQAQRGP